MKSGFLDKLIDRLDKLDPQSVQTQFLRLNREKGLLDAIFNALHEGIIVLDGQGSIQYANNAAARLLGFSVDSALHQPLSRYFRGIDWASILNLDEQEWSKLISREVEINYPQHKFLNFYVMPIMLEDKDEKGAVVIFKDITRDREKEISILKSERLHALTLLAAGVAHEIGNPLNSLHIHLQLMKREMEGLDKKKHKELHESVRVASSEVERLHHTITQFLRAIRPTAPQLEPSRVDELVKETVTFMRHEISNRNVLVEVKCAEPVPVVSVDRYQIKQAFFNLIKNALQAMTDGGLLTITIFSTDQALGLSFKDTGVGIAADKLSHLFETYRTTKREGVGLGLMIVQRIIQDHGGEMEIHSQPKVGTTFTILLPLDEKRIRLLKAPRKPDQLKTNRNEEVKT